MNNTTTLSQRIQQQYTDWSTSINGKTIEDLGGTDAALIMVINEITNIYPFMYAQAVLFENFLSVYETNNTIIDSNFTAFDEELTTLIENLGKQDAALAKSMNKSLQALNKQMINQSKVLDKQVIKLSKSISKITGEQ